MPKATAKKAAKKSAKKSAARRQPTRNQSSSKYYHIIIDYLAEGISAVKRRAEQENIPASILRRAAKEVEQTHPNHAANLVSWVNENYPAGDGVRGKTSPSVGEERAYKAQQVKDSKPFIRLGLETIGIRKGQKVRVKFETKDRIVVERAA